MYILRFRINSTISQGPGALMDPLHSVHRFTLPELNAFDRSEKPVPLRSPSWLITLFVLRCHRRGRFRRNSIMEATSVKYSSQLWMDESFRFNTQNSSRKVWRRINPFDNNGNFARIVIAWGCLDWTMNGWMEGWLDEWMKRTDLNFNHGKNRNSSCCFWTFQMKLVRIPGLVKRGNWNGSCVDDFHLLK